MTRAEGRTGLKSVLPLTSCWQGMEVPVPSPASPSAQGGPGAGSAEYGELHEETVFVILITGCQNLEI